MYFLEGYFEGTKILAIPKFIERRIERMKEDLQYNKLDDMEYVKSVFSQEDIRKFLRWQTNLLSSREDVLRSVINASELYEYTGIDPYAVKDNNKRFSSMSKHESEEAIRSVIREEFTLLTRGKLDLSKTRTLSGSVNPDCIVISEGTLLNKVGMNSLNRSLIWNYIVVMACRLTLPETALDSIPLKIREGFFMSRDKILRITG